jgi:hypothetical protein
MAHAGIIYFIPCSTTEEITEWARHASASMRYATLDE